MSTSQQILKDGLVRNNVVFGQLLALCPLMAVTTNVVNGLGMGLASLAVLVLANVLVSSVRTVIPRDVRIPAFILIIATVVTVVDMAMNAWLHDVHKVLGLFIPLIVTNCAVLGRAEAFASKHGVAGSALDGFAMGAGFTTSLMLIGACRELIGSGTLFVGMSGLLGPSFTWLELRVIPGYEGFLLALLPPGGFLILGTLLALKAFLERPRPAAATPACDGCADPLACSEPSCG